MIATSSGAAAAYVKEGFTNIRIGMFLEIATTVGAVLSFRRHPAPGVHNKCHFRNRPPFLRLRFDPPGAQGQLGRCPQPPGRAAEDELHLSHDPGPPELSRPRGPSRIQLDVVAGGLSWDSWGIGSGALKVIAMDQGMRIPFMFPPHQEHPRKGRCAAGPYPGIFYL